MLLFNSQSPLEMPSNLHFNTSNVTIQQRLLNGISCIEEYFNTSNVTIQLVFNAFCNLNIKFQYI